MIFFKYPFWYYFSAPKKLLGIWGNFIKFFWTVLFPVPLVFKTLFSPWKRTGEKIFTQGFDPKIILKNLAADIVSRFVGFLVKIIILAIAFICEIFVLIFGVLLFAFWLAWPFLLIFSFTLANQTAIAVMLAFGLFSLWAFLKSSELPADKMEAGQILTQKWSDEIWERAEIDPLSVPLKVKQDPEKNLVPFLKERKLKEKDFVAVFTWVVSKQKKLYLQKRFWLKENIFSSGGIGKDWIYGYTPQIDFYSKPLDILQKYEHLVGRREEMEHIETILTRSGQSNVLLIGEPGVGKMSLVQKLSRLIASGNISPALAYKKVVVLDLNRALAGLTAMGQLEERLLKLFGEASRAGNVILVIENFHNLVDPEASELQLGRKNISDIILSFISKGAFQLIAVTTYRGLHEQIEKQQALMKFFEKIEVKEPDEETTKQICIDSVREIESRVPVKMTIHAINETIDKSSIYISDVPFPEKALDLLEEAAIYTARKKPGSLVTPREIQEVLSRKTEIPIGALGKGEQEKLLNLEQIIHERIINQEQAVSDISSAMRRTRLEISEKKRPIGSFLFLGPTRVGKTETAKTLAEVYFGSEERINRFDMSEFQGNDAVEKLIGSRHGDKPGLLTTAVKENPFALLLFDEIEKADYAALNLLLQILEEGWLTDVTGRKINFRNQIIIATSNAGAEFIWEKMKSSPNELNEEKFKKDLIDYTLNKNIFRPELLNRFDAIIIYKPLSPEHLSSIAKLMLASLQKRLAKNDFIFKFSDDLVKKIAELGYEPENGARPMRRVIQKKVEDLIAKKLLKGEISKDSPFQITAAEIIKN